MGRSFSGQIAAAAALAMMLGCGSSSPTAPSGNSGNGGGGGGPATSGATITIGSGGVTPNSVTISVGQGVTIVNNDSISHDIESNPHPTHTDCPSLRVGPLPAGQSRTTAAFTVARSCGFHDHNDPGNGSLQGTVTIR
jgi:plastocyanin